MWHKIEQLNIEELQELVDKIEKLLETKRRERISQVYQQAQQIAQSIGLSLDELATFSGKEHKIKKVKKVAPKYRNPMDTNQIWSGRGKQPKWVVEALASGKSLDDLLIK